MLLLLLSHIISGFAATGSISFGSALVAGSILVPKPAAGITAFVIFLWSAMARSAYGHDNSKPKAQDSFAGDSDHDHFRLSRHAERIPISSQRLSISDGKPKRAKSSPEMIPYGELS